MNEQIMYNRPLQGAQLNMAHPLTRGLIGCWLLNEEGGSRCMDISPYQNHGLVSVGTIKGTHGGRLFGGGSTQRINCGDKAILSPTAAMSVFAFCKDDSAGLEQHIASKVTEWTGGWALVKHWLDATKIAADIVTVAGLKSAVSPTGLLIRGRWMFTGFTFSGTSLILYVDNIPVASSTFAATTAVTTTTQFQIGNRQDSTNSWGGTLAGIWFYNRVLTKEERTELHLEPYGMILR